jgi:transposase
LVRNRLTDAEWAIFAPFLTQQLAQGGRPPKDHRRTLDGIFWITRTGAPWRDLPEELGKWNSVHRQFRRWTTSGVWDVLLQALADSGGEADMLQMIDSTIVRAHHCAAGGRGGPTVRLSAARVAASRPSSTCAAMPMACPSVSC